MCDKELSGMTVMRLTLFLVLTLVLKAVLRLSVILPLLAVLIIFHTTQFVHCFKYWLNSRMRKATQDSKTLKVYPSGTKLEESRKTYRPTPLVILSNKKTLFNYTNTSPNPPLLRQSPPPCFPDKSHP